MASGGYRLTAQMRIMTANLWNTNVEVASFTAALDQFEPDVVAVQELDHGAAEELRARYPYGEIRPGGVAGCALVSKSPMDVSVIEIPFRPLLTTTVGIDGQAVNVGAVHLGNPVALADLPHRWHQLAALLDADDGTSPAVLVGDFNSSPAWPAYRKLAKSYQDGAADWAKRAGQRPPRTWNYKAGIPKALRIDHVWVRGLDVHELNTAGIAGSDHLALIADVILAPGQRQPTT